MIANRNLSKIIRNREDKIARNHLLELYARGTDEEHLEVRIEMQKLFKAMDMPLIKHGGSKIW